MDLRDKKLKQLDKEELFLYIALSTFRHLKIENPTLEQIRSIYTPELTDSRIRKILARLREKKVIPQEIISGLLEEGNEKNTGC